MAATKRAQVLMEPAEYARLERLARVRHVSVGELIRLAVRKEYLEDERPSGSIVDAIAASGLPVADWVQLEQELLEGYDDRLP
jgi:hypothetical protein